MKKMALVVPSLIKGGGVPSVARFVKNQALQSGCYELKLISLCMSSRDVSSRLISRPRTWLRGPVARQDEWERLPFCHVGANFGELEFQRYKQRRILTEQIADCDLIQVVCGSPAWASAVIGLGIPVSLQVATRAIVERRQRDSMSQGPRGVWGKAMTYLTDRLDDKAIMAVDAIQVENPWMLDYCRALNGDRAVDLRYAPPGVNADVFKPLSKRDVTSKPYILCVGRLGDVRKNIVLLLEAYARLPKAIIDNVPLCLAGSSGPNTLFWRRAGELGVANRIRFIEKPSREELVSLYQHATVFSLPSDEEGLGVVILEAMACGVPAVCTRSGGPEGIISDGEDGFLVPLNNVQILTECLKKLLTNPELNRTMGLKARLTIDERYAERVAGRAFIDTWDRLLQR